MGQEIISWFLPAAVGISFLVAVLIWLSSDKSVQLHNWLLTGSAVITLGLVLSLLPSIWRGEVVGCKIFLLIPQMEIAFRADGLSFLFALIASSLWLIVSVYSAEYMRREKNLSRYNIFLALCMSSTLGIAFAANLFTLFLFYESLSICTYPLIVHEQSPKALKAGRKYLFYSLAGGAVLLLALLITYHLSGHLDLGRGVILSSKSDSSTLYLLFAAYMIGFGVKGVLMPLHGWLPDSMIAPTPVSAILHAVAVVKAGVYGILRTIIDVFGFSLMKQLQLNKWLLIVACITILLGSIMAIYQDSLKKMLAYSTISQLSYVTLGVILATPSGVTGGLLHMLYQAVMKISLFMCAGVIYRQTGITRISQMRGLGQRLPLTMGAFSVAALGMIGIPSTAGFISKWHLALGALEAHQLLVVGIIIISALLNAVYFLPVIYIAFFQQPYPEQEIEISRPSWKLVGPCLVTASLVLAFGLVPWLHRLPLFLAQSIGKGFLTF